MRKGVLSPLLIRNVVAWVEERCLQSTFHSLMPHIAGRVFPGVISAGELSLPLPNCNTQKDEPCASSRQHNRAGSNGIGVAELTLNLWTVCELVIISAQSPQLLDLQTHIISPGVEYEEHCMWSTLETVPGTTASKFIFFSRWVSSVPKLPYQFCWNYNFENMHGLGKWIFMSY